MLVMLHVVVVVGASASLTHRLYVGVIMIRFECLLWHAAFAASCRWLKTEGPLHQISVMACSPQDGASTPIPELGHAGISSGLSVATWNAGMDQDNSFSKTIDSTMAKLADAICELAKTCHVIGINELHPEHVGQLQQILQTRGVPFKIKSFNCNDALVWNPSFVQHLGSKNDESGA